MPTLSECVKLYPDKIFIRKVHQCRVINGILYDINEDTLSYENMVQLSVEDLVNDDWKLIEN